MVEGADGDGAVEDATQGGGEGGDADRPVAGVGDDVRVGGQLLAVLLQQRPQGP
ncbi:hypothetical protein SDC9_210834 [bioreactor metagenome]|uniref:Uncharacterized protein n=1 Tax=bioreactor metagenome TaxID=1076179 RepID=A0A645JIZ0_9ZZZZ